LNVGPSWTTGARPLVGFHKDGHIYGPNNEDLGTYQVNTWYHLRVKYEYPVGSQARIGVWLNNARLGVSTVTSTSYEASLSYLSITAHAGTSWYDRCRVSY